MIANPSSVYGPGPWQGAGVDGFIRDAARGRLPVLPPGGLTLAYVDDVAEGHLAAFDRGAPGERYILADGFATNREVCQAVVEAAGGGRVPPTLPAPVARSVAVASEGVVAADPPPAADRKRPAHLPPVAGARRLDARRASSSESSFAPGARGSRRPCAG